MAASDISLFAVKGQAYPAYVMFRSFATGNTWTGALSSLTAVISKDSGAYVSTTNTPVQVDATQGLVRVDLTAAEMNAGFVSVIVSSTSTNAINQCVGIVTGDLTETTTHWMGQTPKRLEQGILQGASYLLNQVQENGSAITMYKFNSSTTYLSSTIVNAGTLSATKGQMG